MSSAALDVGDRRRPLRFLLAATANTIFGLSIYPLLLWSVPLLQTHYMVALGIAQVLSVSFAYLTYKLGVFRTKGRVLSEFSAFSGFYLFNYVANWLGLPLLVELGGIEPVVAQLGFTAVVMVSSWFWHSKVTFRRRETRP
jgi:putative flippase GtrA